MLHIYPFARRNWLTHIQRLRIPLHSLLPLILLERRVALLLQALDGLDAFAKRLRELVVWIFLQSCERVLESAGELASEEEDETAQRDDVCRAGVCSEGVAGVKRYVSKNATSIAMRYAEGLVETKEGASFQQPTIKKGAASYGARTRINLIMKVDRRERTPEPTPVLQRRVCGS